VAALAVATFVGCKRSERAAADSARVADSVAAATPAPPPAAPATPVLTDANIVFILDAANIADSARGTLAASKGTHADVRSFGKMMAGEHHAIHVEEDALAKKLGVTPLAPPNDMSDMQAKQEMDSLTAMPKGDAWDKSYIDYEVAYHRGLLETATKALDATQNPELKALIQKAAPVVQKHLDRALEVQKKLGGG
jgi:putative membrane protein